MGPPTYMAHDCMFIYMYVYIYMYISMNIMIYIVGTKRENKPINTNLSERKTMRKKLSTAEKSL
jgi:hypothetical protein